MADIDPLTGSTYEREKLMYMNYHNLSEEQAAIVMSYGNYRDRDATCQMFIELNSIKPSA